MRDMHQFRSQGLVADVLGEDVLRKLKGSSAIGHTRYSTSGRNTIKEVQPFAVTCQHGDIAVCHHGNLPFAAARRRELEKDGAIFSSTADSPIPATRNSRRTTRKLPARPANFSLT